MLNKLMLSALISILSFSVFAGPMTEIKTQDELLSYIENGKFNGVVLVAKDKDVLLRKAFGYKNLNKKIPLSLSDKFQIGSNTKQFVAASILKLQEEGKLSINDEITDYLPNLVQYEGIKIKDVLNHTSGIPNYTDIEKFWKNVSEDKVLSLDDIISFSVNYPLDFEPRTKWSYSNTGYIIAGKLVEKLSGKSWDQFINEIFLIPLQMNDTGYEVYFDKVSDVRGHLLDSNGSLKTTTELNLSWALSAGALYSTVDDLLKWTSIYNNSNLLSEASTKEMQTPFLGNYGLGLWVGPYKNDIMLKHGGRTPGFVSNIIELKNSKVKVITLDNIDGSSFDISSLLISFYYEGSAQALKLQSYPVTTRELKAFEGVYSANEMEIRIFLKNGSLYLQPNDGQPAYLLKCNDKDSFSLGFAGEEFLRDDSGAVKALKHYQGGGTTIFTKKKSSLFNRLKNKIQHSIFKRLTY